MYSDPGFTDPTRNAARSNRGWAVGNGQAAWPGPAAGDFYLNDSNTWGEAAGLTVGVEYEFAFTVAAASGDVWVNWYKSDPWVSLSNGQGVGTTPTKVTFRHVWSGPQTFVGVWVGGPAVITNPQITVVGAATPLSYVTSPERGWYHYTETHETVAGDGRVPLTVAGLQAVRALGRTVVFRYYVLDKYLGLDAIEQSYLDHVAADCAAVREAGVKLMPRFTYSTQGGMVPPYNADPPPARVLGHIAQICPVLSANADIVDSVQAGFIGMWGEWYYTDHFGDLGSMTTQQWAARKAIVDALLEHLDPKIFVLIRYVGVMRRLLDAEPGNQAYATRLGHHNDAFLTDEHDWGTYGTFSDGYTGAQNRVWLAARNQAGRFPVVGETAGLLERSTASNALAEIVEYRWTALNPSYHPDVLAAWGELGRAAVGARLGYRLELSDVTATPDGQDVAVSFTVINTGSAAPYRDRPILVDFVTGGTVVTRELAGDVRDWTPGETVVSGQVAAPGAGTWELFVRLPDAALPDAPLHALALVDGFDFVTGRNATGQSVTSTHTPLLAMLGTVPVVRTYLGDVPVASLATIV